MESLDSLLQSALTYHQQGQLTKAKSLYQQVLNSSPTHSDALHLLGVLLHQTQAYSEAETYLRQALKLKPQQVVYLTHLGNLLREIGQVEEAIRLFKQVLRIEPHNQAAHLSLLVSLIASPTISEMDFFRYFQHWAKTYPVVSQRVSPQPKEKLHIGYVSPDFRNNSAAWLYRLVFEHHSREHFKILAYGEVNHPDEMTDFFRQSADQWVNTVGLSDQELIKQIQTDQIDILVDMAGHTANNRLAVFAQRPAPLLVTGFAGFTTGMDVFDYRLTDQYVTPPNWSQANSEKLFYLPHHVMHWQPPPSDLPISPSPFLTNGYITFGSGHQLFKINQQVIELWSEILKQVPTAKLHLKAKPLDDPGVKNRLLKDFENQGIAAERLLFSGASSHQDHIAFYQQVDLVLEAFPCSGGITTCEVLWMGVPYLTSAQGSRSRAGISILQAMQVPELIAKDLDDFVSKAVQLANQPEQLESLRQTLRSTFLLSPIANGQSYIRDLETAYQIMWKQLHRQDMQ